MGEGLSLLEQTRGIVFMVFLIGMALLLFVALIRAIKGPQVADRLMAVNMMGTIVMVMLAILALFLGEDYLLDICLIYAMVSFLAVIVFSKVYIGIYEEKRHHTDETGTGAASGAAEARVTEEKAAEEKAVEEDIEEAMKAAEAAEVEYKEVRVETRTKEDAKDGMA